MRCAVRITHDRQQIGLMLISGQWKPLSMLRVYVHGNALRWTWIPQLYFFTFLFCIIWKVMNFPKVMKNLVYVIYYWKKPVIEHTARECICMYIIRLLNFGTLFCDLIWVMMMLIHVMLLFYAPFIFFSCLNIKYRYVFMMYICWWILKKEKNH